MPLGLDQGVGAGVRSPLGWCRLTGEDAIMMGAALVAMADSSKACLHKRADRATEAVAA